MDIYIIDRIKFRLYEAVVLVCFNEDNTETILGCTLNYN